MSGGESRRPQPLSRGAAADAWTVEPCHGHCGKLVRRSRLKVADYPGTVADCGGRRCGPCREQQFHNGHSRTQDSTRTTEENRAHLNAWLQSRGRAPIAPERDEPCH